MQNMFDFMITALQLLGKKMYKLCWKHILKSLVVDGLGKISRHLFINLSGIIRNH